MGTGMSRAWGYLAGGGALLLAGIVGTQAVMRSDVEAPTAASTSAATASEAASTGTQEQDDAARLAAAEAEIGRLTERLAAAEAENAELRSTLTLRDTVLATLNATVAERDAALADVRGRLAMNETELTALRGQLESLRKPADFDQALTTMKLAEGPSAARIEPAAVTPDHSFSPASAVPPAEGPLVEVQFDFASAALTPGGQERATLAAAALAGMVLDEVRVIGHTDRVGRPEANRRLAARRADAVARFLVEAGLPADIIVTDGAGESGAPVATDDGVPEPLNRSVLIFAQAKPLS